MHLSGGLVLSKRKYIVDLLTHFNMMNAKPVQTPLAMSTILSLHDGALSTDTSRYKQVVGSLQYILLTRPDMAFAVNHMSQFIHSPSEHHWDAVKHVLHYLNENLDHGLHIWKHESLSLHDFTDAD